MNVDQITQTAIALLGASAVWLSQSRTNRFQKWACIVGLLQQPFWFWATWRSGQWGMFLVSIVCTLAWVKGLWIHWLTPNRVTGLDMIELPPESRLR